MVESDIITRFSHHLLMGWHGFAVVSDMRTDKTNVVLLRSFLLDFMIFYSFSALQIYNFICLFCC